MRSSLLWLRLLVGGLYVYAGWEKIAHPLSFLDTLLGHDLLPLHTVTLLVVLLPWWELVAGLCLFLGLLTRSSGLLLLVLTLIFTAVVIRALALGLDTRCGCFGEFGTVSGLHLLLNLGCLAVLMILLRSPLTAYSLDRYWAGE